MKKGAWDGGEGETGLVKWGGGGELREIDLGKVRHRLTSVILAVRRMKQGDCQEFKVSLEYIACFRPA